MLKDVNRNVKKILALSSQTMQEILITKPIKTNQLNPI